MMAMNDINTLLQWWDRWEIRASARLVDRIVDADQSLALAEGANHL